MKIETRQEKLRFGASEFKLKRVKNLDELVDQVDDVAFAEDERLPYWAELWPSAIALSRFILSQPELFREKDVLELGCGLGLTSLALAQTDPARLLLTDYEQDALDLSAENFKLNNLPQPECALLDWRDPQLEETFDVLIASDVLYEERFFRPIINVLGNRLKKNGTCILAEPGRPIAKGFFELLLQAGFILKQTDEQVEQGNKIITVHIFLIKK